MESTGISQAMWLFRHKMLLGLLATGWFLQEKPSQQLTDGQDVHSAQRIRSKTNGSNMWVYC